jgi:hypothetical protein
MGEWRGRVGLSWENEGDIYVSHFFGYMYIKNGRIMNNFSHIIQYISLLQWQNNGIMCD